MLTRTRARLREGEAKWNTPSCFRSADRTDFHICEGATRLYSNIFLFYGYFFFWPPKSLDVLLPSGAAQIRQESISFILQAGDSNYFRVIYIKPRRELRCPHSTWCNLTQQPDTNRDAGVCLGGNGTGGWNISSKILYIAKKKKRGRIKEQVKEKGYSPRMVCLFSAGERLNTLTCSPGSVL